MRVEINQTTHRDQVHRYKDEHRGQRCFILACGPSLDRVSQTALVKEHKIAVNHAIYKFPDSEYVVIGDLKNGLEISTGDSVLFSSQEPQHISGSVVMKDLGHLPGFSTDLTEGVFFGHTTTYIALQIAVYMGFSPIYLLGLDLKDSDTKTHFYGKRIFQTLPQRKHLFDCMLESFNWAALTLPELEIYNCTPDSALKAYPYKSFEEVMTNG